MSCEFNKPYWREELLDEIRKVVREELERAAEIRLYGPERGKVNSFQP